MMVPTVSSTGSGSNVPVPGPRGYSAYQIAQQEEGFEGTAAEWVASIKGKDGESVYEIAQRNGFEGTEAEFIASLAGTPGASVELRKTATAIQMRTGADGEWVDLVQLADLKGEPGDSTVISDMALSGYVDTGNMRQAWGTDDFVSVTEQTFLFPAPFAKPPTVQVTRASIGPALVARKVTTTGFTLSRSELRGNPVPFSWTASGIKQGVTVPATARFNVDKLATLSASIRAQKAGVRMPRILCAGDSTTAGFGANAASAVTNDKANSYPTYLAQILTARGLPATWANWIGNGNTPQFNTYDYRVTFTTGWGLSNQDTPITVGHTAGGFALRTGVTAGQGKLAFDTLSPVDTVEIYFFMRQPATATNFIGFIVDIDGTDVATYITSFDNSNPGGLFKVTQTMPVGRHTIGIRSYAQTDSVFCLGMIAYNSSIKEVSVVNCGWGASRSVDWNNQQGRAWAPLSAMDVLDGDLVIWNMGINDSVQDNPAVAGQRVQKEFYMRDMQACIDRFRGSGADVLLMIPNQIGNEYAGYLNRFIPFMQELAERNNLPVISIPDILGSTWDIANAAGWMRDRAHPNAAGYQKIATAIADLIYPVGS